ncbi:MAG TPA: hypothetical protein VL137_01070 [Polyangiaceae bacterium]|nr:hypothetical protein [Polyangiaceae bacterium]
MNDGQDFQVAEVVFDEGYFYCQVEPMLFAKGCGSGDPARGEDGSSCHFSVTAFRLTDYGPPRVNSGCSGNKPSAGPPSQAQRNYASAQLFMDRDPDRAPLLQRPTHTTAHPRVVISENSAEADVIRQWAARFSSR